MYWKQLYLPYAMDFCDLVASSTQGEGGGPPATEEVTCRASALSMQGNRVELYTVSLKARNTAKNRALLLTSTHGTHTWRFFPATLSICMLGIK